MQFKSHLSVQMNQFLFFTDAIIAGYDAQYREHQLDKLKIITENLHITPT